MVHEIKGAFAHNVEPELEPHEMYFAHFLELFCRVALEFHNQILIREGAQVRRAIESSRLEFSIEMLLQHMNIKIMRDSSPPTHLGTSQQQLNTQQIKASSVSSDQVTGAAGLEELTLEVENLFTDENKTFESLVDDIRLHLNALDRANASTATRAKRGQSVLFSRLPPRKVPLRTDSNAISASILGGSVGVSDKIPLVTLIREPVSPPELPSSVLAKLESAITYQNMGQYHVRLPVDILVRVFRDG